MERLDGRVAVVTGAASGIGLAMTEAFVAEGMKVVMADIEEGPLVAQAQRLSTAGADVFAVACNVTDAAAVSDLAAQTLTTYGAAHLLCNNAGVAPAGPMLATSAAEWRWCVDVNVLGVAHGVLAFAPLMKEAGVGHIVNTASEAGLSTNNMLGMYCATKHAVVGLSESLYRELEGSGVGVSCLCPELVRTSIFESERNAPADVNLSAAAGATLAPLREMISVTGIAPSDVADAVVDAVKTDRFWVFTHPVTPGRAIRRMHDIEAGRNPSDAYS